MAKILIIDDDGIVRDALSVFLVRAGHEVVTAADGLNGVQVFKNSVPDLVVLDRDLPGLSGSKVFDSIRKISKDVPVIVVSGYDKPEEVQAYLRCGAAAFLPKSGGLSPVLEEIEKMVGKPAAAAAPAQAAPVPAVIAPVAAAPAAPAAAAPVKAAAAPVPQPAASAPSKPAVPLVLVADDEVSMRSLLCRFLVSIGCETVEASDGAQAVALARMRKPDIVLLDIAMPKKNGVQVMTELMAELPNAGFIMVTGNGDEDVARKCLDLGAFDYLPKPVSLDNLEKIVKARLLLQGK